MMLKTNAFNIIMNLGYKEELSLYLSSYPSQWQKLLVVLGVAVLPYPSKVWHHSWLLVADEDRVSHVFSHVVW